MYSRLVPQLVFPAYERLTGRRFWTEVEQLRSRQWTPPAELEARVAVGRLQALLAHAAAHVPHYREVLGAGGLDARVIRTVDDLARVPITTKAALRRRFPDGVSAENLPARRRMRGVTSGSTGQPLEFYLDRAAADTWTGAYLFFLEWAGTAFWHTEVVIASPRHFYLAGRHVGPATACARRWLLGREQVWLAGPDTTLATLRSWRSPARRGAGPTIFGRTRPTRPGSPASCWRREAHWRALHAPSSPLPKRCCRPSVTRSSGRFGPPSGATIPVSRSRGSPRPVRTIPPFCTSTRNGRSCVSSTRSVGAWPPASVGAWS